MRVYVCVPLLAGSGGPASRVRFGAPHLFLWPVLVLSLSARPPPGWGCPACGYCCLFFVVVRPCCLWRSVFFSPGCLGPWRLVPPPSFFFSPSPSSPAFFSCPFFCSSLFGAFFLASFLFFSCRGVPVVRCLGDLCVLGCGACWCVLLWALCSGGGWFAVALFCFVLPACAWSLCLVAGCVARVRGHVLAALLFSVLPLVPCLCGLSSGLVLRRRFWPVVALRPLGAVVGLPGSCPAVWPCIGVCYVALFGVVFCPFVGCRVVLPAPIFCWVCAGCAAPPGWSWCPVLRVVVRCVVWCCGLWCVLCFGRCCVVCMCRAGSLRRVVRRGVVPGPVVLFLLCFAVVRCCVLCCFFLSLFPALPWCLGLFLSLSCFAVVLLAVRCGLVALRPCAGFCCAVPFSALLCRGASLGSVLCCLYCRRALVAPCLVCCCGGSLCSVCPWARCCVVLLCCLWSGCYRSLCRVSERLAFRGAPCAVLCWCACVVALCAMLSCPCGAGWCFVLFPIVSGCLLLGLAVPCCLLVGSGGS